MANRTVKDADIAAKATPLQETADRTRMKVTPSPQYRQQQLSRRIWQVQWIGRNSVNEGHRCRKNGPTKKSRCAPKSVEERSQSDTKGPLSRSHRNFAAPKIIWTVNGNFLEAVNFGTYHLANTSGRHCNQVAQVSHNRQATFKSRGMPAFLSLSIQSASYLLSHSPNWYLTQTAFTNMSPCSSLISSWRFGTPLSST